MSTLLAVCIQRLFDVEIQRSGHLSQLKVTLKGRLSFMFVTKLYVIFFKFVFIRI